MSIADDLAATFGGKWEHVSSPSHGFYGVVDELAAEKMSKFFKTYCVPHTKTDVKDGVAFTIPGTCIDLLSVAERHYGYAAAKTGTKANKTQR